MWFSCSGLLVAGARGDADGFVIDKARSRGRFEMKYEGRGTGIQVRSFSSNLLRFPRARRVLLATPRIN